MKNILRIGMLLCMFLLGSVGWAMAQAEEESQTNGVNITSDLIQALVGQETVYCVTTTKGSVADNTLVRVTVEGANLSELSFWYYEPNIEPKGWKVWNPVDQGFGPSTGFPLIDGTSYFKVQPTKEGVYTYTMSVKTVEDSPKTLATATCTMNAVNALTHPYASITTNGESGNVTVNYVSIHDAMRFVEEGQTINLSAGDFELSSPLVINKAITIEGQDTTQTTIKGVFDINAEGESIAFKNITLSAATATGRGVVDIKSSNTTVSFENSKVVIEKSGSADSGAGCCFGVVSQLYVDENTINFDQSRMVMTGKFQRALAFRNGAGHTINFTNSKLEGPASGDGANQYTIGICAWPGGTECTEPVTYNISNSLIDICYYAVFAYNNDNIPLNINIDKSSITAWSALYLRGDGVQDGSFTQTVNITESQLCGRSFFNGQSDGFAAVVLEVSPNIDMTIDSKSSITTQHLNPNNTPITYHTPFDLRSARGTIKFTGDGTQKCRIQAFNAAYTDNIFEYDTKSGFPACSIAFSGIDNTEMLNEQGEKCIQIYNQDNTFKNAVTGFPKLFIPGVLAANDIIKLPALTYALESPLSLSFPLTIEGADIDRTIFKAATKGESAVSGQNLITLNGSGANGTKIKNLTIQDANNYGLHVYQAENVTLENVALKDNLAGGMYVNGSTVTATDIQTSGNVWGGIEVGKGTNVTTDPELTISNSTLSEATQIWADTNADKYGSAISGWVNAEGYSNFEYQPENKNYKQTFWTNRQQITIKVDKSSFIYNSGTKQTIQYTTVPADIEGITVTYYDDEAGTTNPTTDGKEAVGTYYVFFTRLEDNQYFALNEMVVMTITNKSVPTISTPASLQESVLEAGLPLSMYHLVPGKAVINQTEVIGTYSWADGNQVLTEGENRLTYIFTPANLAQMDIVTGTITANANRYFTVKTGVSANGKATITNKSTSDRYVKDSQLTLTVTPDEGYTFTGWKDLSSNSLTYTVTEDKELVAEFAKKQFTVNYTNPENGTLTVKNESGEVTSGATLDYGTVLTVAVSANDGYTADAITTTGSALVKGEIFLDANTTITATVTAIPSTPKTITITQPTGGSIRVTNKATGKEIVSGTQVTEGTNILIERTPNKGYKLASTEQTREEMTINADETITATFQPETYSVTASTGGGYTLSLNPSGNLHYGDEVTITSSLNAGYKGIAMMVNEKEVPANGSFIVTGNMTVKYIVEEKATLSIPNENQSYVYNGRAQAFVVKTTPAGLTNVNVTYKKNGIEVGTPTDAGEYDVYITRAEDENYKAFSETRKLTITKAPVIITNRPSDTSGTNGAASVDGSWSSGAKPENPVKPILRAAEGQYAVFTPSSENYAQGYCLPGSAMNIKVTINQPTDGSGTISVWDGNLQIANSESNNALSGSELTIYATPAVGYKLTNLNVTGGTATAQSDGSYKITPTANITVSAAFAAKATLNPTISGVDDLVYNGTVKTATISATGVTTGWNYSVQQNGITVSPINAGTYDVLITREEDDTYQAYRQLRRGALVIRKATPTYTAPSATVVKNALLATAELSGGASSTDGTFVWENPNATFTSNGTANMKFIPSDAANFNEVFNLSATVTVSDVQAVTFTQPEHATLTVKRGETVLQSGDVIADGDVLTITVTPANGYVFESLKVNGSNFSNGGTYTVANGATVTIVATVKEYVAPIIPGGGGGTVDPDPVIPTVSNPVVAERTATTAAVTWEKVSGATSYKLFLYAKKTDSTPLKIYEFDKDGKLKATAISFTLTGLEEGKAYYVETAAYNASGTLLVKKSVELSATPTGIEAISEGSQLYTVKGAIVVAPAEPLQVAIYSVTGQTLFNDEVSYLTQVPAQAGIYVVVIQKGNDRITEKVIVK